MKIGKNQTGNGGDEAFLDGRYRDAGLDARYQRIRAWFDPRLRPRQSMPDMHERQRVIAGYRRLAGGMAAALAHMDVSRMLDER